MIVKFCRKCCHRVYPELKLEQYPLFCPNCDENLFEIETFEDEFDGNEFFHVTSSNGDLYLDILGNVVRQETNEQCGKLVWFDLSEYVQVWKQDVPQELDILDLRGIFEDGTELIWSEYKRRLYELENN